MTDSSSDLGGPTVLRLGAQLDQAHHPGRVRLDLGAAAVSARIPGDDLVRCDQDLRAALGGLISPPLVTGAAAVAAAWLVQDTRLEG